MKCKRFRLFAHIACALTMVGLTGTNPTRAAEHYPASLISMIVGWRLADLPMRLPA